MRLTSTLFWLMSLATFPAYADSPTRESEKAWGSKISLTEVVSLDEAIKKLSEKNQQSASNEILVHGKAEKVCQKKGCWLTLGSTASSVRVTFKGYKFFVPFSLQDQFVKVQGILKEEVISVFDQKHYLKDEGRPQKDIDAITEPKKSYTLVASGVEKV